MKDLLNQYRDSLANKAAIAKVIGPQFGTEEGPDPDQLGEHIIASNKSDSLAHQIAQRMLDVSSGLSERLRERARRAEQALCNEPGEGEFARPDISLDREAADALALAEAEKAESEKAWEDVAELMEPTPTGNGFQMRNVHRARSKADFKAKYEPDYIEANSEPLAHAQIAKAKDRIAKRGGV